jgi:hypothetical protein
LKRFIDSPGSDRLLEIVWNEGSDEKINTVQASSHLEMDDKFITCDPYRISEDYKILNGLVDTQFAQEENEDDNPDTSQSSDPTTSPLDEEDPAVGLDGCDICGVRFTHTMTSALSRYEISQQHRQSPEHENNRKIHAKYEEQVKPLVDDIEKKFREVEALCNSIKDDDPDIYSKYDKCINDHDSFTQKLMDFEKAKKWRESGTITFIGRMLLQQEDDIIQKIKNSKIYKVSSNMFRGLEM